MSKIKSRASKRQRRSSDQWQALLARYESAALSVAAFCACESISEASFYRWRGLLASSGAGHELAPAAAGFVDLGAMVSISMQNFPVLGWKQRPIVSTPVCNYPVFLPGVVWSVLHGHYLRNTSTPRSAEAIDFCHRT
ncbi:MAG: IS66 family insertion sequence element accessory protein TnpA [Burkholderiaceae bacterium]